MSIENSLKRIVNCGYPIDYVSDTEEILNNEIVICTDDSPDISSIEIAVYPKKLILSCEICADPINVQSRVFDSSGYSENVYSDQFPAYKNVTLKYIGFGKILFDDGTVVNFYDNRAGPYKMDFNSVLLKQSFVYQQTDLKHTNVANELQLMAYGGRFNPKDDISQIQQMFFQIKQGQKAVSVAISDEAFWRNKEIDPFVGGVFHGKSNIKIISPPGCVKQPSMAEIISTGQLKILITNDSLDKMEAKSKSYSQKLNKIDIMFDI